MTSGNAQVSLPPQSDRVLAAALDAAAVLVVVIDAAGVPVYVNDAACEVSGYDRDELSSRSMLDRVDPDHRDDAEDVIDRLWRGDLPSDYVLPWVASDGRRIRIRWRFSHLADDDGAVTHIVAVGIDITRQHVLGQARRAAEERFRLSFDGAPVGMAVIRAGDDGEAVAVAVNRAMCRLLGRQEDDLVGRDVADVTHPDDMPHERRWVAAWVARGAEHVFQYEKRFVTGSGEIVWTSVHVSLIAGEPDGRFFLVHALDITDRKRAQQSALGGSVDPLTGLLIEPAFLRELQARLAEDLPLAVVRLKLLSADDVQAVHGYAARDELVERGARRLNTALPPDARLARVGADEFAAFFKATGRESLQVTKNALARIAADPSAATRTAAHISFAAGVAACDPGQHDRAEAIYTSAGVALEDALRGGTGAALSGRAARERAAKRLSWQSAAAPRPRRGRLPRPRPARRPPRHGRRRVHRAQPADARRGRQARLPRRVPAGRREHRDDHGDRPVAAAACPRPARRAAGRPLRDPAVGRDPRRPCAPGTRPSSCCAMTAASRSASPSRSSARRTRCHSGARRTASPSPAAACCS